MKQRVLRLIQGVLIGVGAVLPGISGGALCVVFGIYRPIMELLSHPRRACKEYAALLVPTVLGIGSGFLGISRLVGVLLNRYPDPSVCLFVGLIAGMLPALFREAGEKGRNRSSAFSLGICFIVVGGLLLGLNRIQISITPSIGWNLFCGFCVALSVIVPGLSFSTLLMPLGLYTPFLEGIGHFKLQVILPAGIGAVLTVLLLAKLVTRLMEQHYSVIYHGIIGVVMAATIAIIPFQGFAESFHAFITNICWLLIGIAAALLLDRFNRRIETPDL